MPALRMLNRRWSIASDDLPVLAFFPTVLHGLYTLALGVGWIVLGRPSGCQEGAGYSVVVAGLFFCFLANFLLGCWLIHEGLKGSVFETHLRWRVPYILYSCHAVLAIEICINCYGSYVIHQPPPYCPTDPTLWQPKGVGQVVVWTTWAIVALILLMVVSTYNMFPNYKDQKSWERRCWCLTAMCCCKWSRPPQHAKGDKRPPYARLAELFAQLFGAMDWAPSDLLVAFMLAGALQNARRRAAVYAALGLEPDGASAADGAADQDGGRAQRLKQRFSSFSSADVMLEDCFLERHSADVESGAVPLLTPSGLLAELRPELSAVEAARLQSGERELVSDEDLDEAAHFSKYAFAAYGYMLYVWSKPQWKGWCMLCCGRRCGCLTGPLRSWQAAFAAGQWLPDLKLTNNMNREAILQITGLPEDDVLFVRFEADLHGRPCLPYFIALDRATKSVVICIRGTLSLDDCLTDAMCEPAEIDDWLLVAEDDDGGSDGARPAHNPPGHTESPNSLMSGARNSPHADRSEASTSQRPGAGDGGVPHWDQRARLNSEAEARGAGDGWQLLRGPLAGREVGAGSAMKGPEGDGGTSTSGEAGKNGGGGGGGRAERPRRFSRMGSFGRYTPPHVQLASKHSQGTAHFGILEAAKDLVSDLASEGVLEALLEGRGRCLPMPPIALLPTAGAGALW